MKPVRLPTPARLYDEALRFVNARRKEKRLRPLKALPAGISWDSSSCPCAAKCGAPIFVDHVTWMWCDDERESVGAPLNFIRWFDAEAEPDVLTLPVRGVRRAKKCKR